MVDVILADARLTPRACCTGCTLDWAAGSSENDFELTLGGTTSVVPERGWYFWIDGSNVGGRIVDQRSTVTGQSSTRTWIGIAWQGMLADKILQPDTGKDYLVVSGTVSSVLATLVRRVGLDGVFTVRAGDKDPTQNYQFQNPRYVDAYTGLAAMLQSCGLRLDFAAIDNKIIMSARSIAHYTDSVDSDLINFTAETNHRIVNHLIGLGQQELKNRLISHWYADENGTVSRTQTLKGVDEITEIYDYSCADQKTLDENTMKRLQELQSGGKVDVTVGDELSDRIMIGDRITARDHNTGLTVTSTVTKQIVRIDGDTVTRSYEIGQQDTTTAGHSSDSGSTSGGDATYSAGNGITIANGTISAEVNKSDLESVRSTANAANSLASGLNESIGKANTTANAAKDSADQARAAANERVKTITTASPINASRDGDTVTLSAPRTLPAPTQLDVAANLNDMKTSYGAYWVPGGNKVTGKPSGVQHFGLFVARSARGITSQLLVDPVTDRVWLRTWNSSAWSAWKALANDAAATSGRAGLMSATDKAKLDTVAANANAYTLPAATMTALGGVKPDGTTIHVTEDGTISAADLSSAEASFLAAHPVGSIIMLRPGVNPAQWGGEWRELPSTGACTWERIN